MIKKRALVALIALLALQGNASPANFIDLATPFETVAIETAGQHETVRTAAVRRAVNSRLPGIYPDNSKTTLGITRALNEFPIHRAAYDRVVREFPLNLEGALTRFRRIFPNFSPPIPVYLYHSLGARDGGSDFIEPGHREVMLFGADMIAAIHNDDSLQPFFDHELFHLEHSRAFPDCDQFWCGLWQEGLAVEAADLMTPHATDHQLGLDQPKAIRALTDAHWSEALCYVSIHFDDTDDAVIAQALQSGSNPPTGLPNRFGYYVGYRLAKATGVPLQALDQLGHQAARRLLRSTLLKLMIESKVTCAPPATRASTTNRSPHPV